MADIVWKTVTFPPAFLGIPYEAGLATASSASVITACTVTSGSLPPGLAVAADFVRLVGTPTKQGTYTFKLTSTDTLGAVQSGSLTITVSPGSAAYREMTQAPVAAQYATMWPQ